MSRFWIGAIVIGIALKIGLLITSQSMPDGDEAVEGLMAMHILAKGVHPVYPYGINYGAGAGWEAHLAALLFAIFGPSEVVLKCVGLFHYLVTMGLVAALARFWRGPNAGLLAAGLFATAPQTAQWALKCAGGHQVAVILALAAWLCVLRGQIALAVVLLPLAAFAHPIVLPFVAAITVCLLIFCNSWRDRGLRFVGVVVAAVIELVLLRPPSQSVWNPMSTSIDLPKRLIAFPIPLTS